MDDMVIKYPTTPYLDFSPSQGRSIVSLDNFKNKQIVVTEKMDGQCFSMTRDFVYARSVDDTAHPSYSYIKNLHSSIHYLIPNNITIIGEYMYAKHSIKYTQLPDYFLVFAVRSGMVYTKWEHVIFLSELLGLYTVPVLYAGVCPPQGFLEGLMGESRYGGEQEGFVIRTKARFDNYDFGSNVAKYVRKDHVQDDHWKYKTIIRNNLRTR